MKIVQIGCGNPKCKKIFEVAYGQRYRKFCSHSCASSVTITNINKRPESRERSRQKIIKLNKEHEGNEEYSRPRREAASKSLKERWKDPDFIKLQKEKGSLQLKEKWKDPAFRQEKIRVITNYSKSDVGKEKSSKQLKELWKNPEFRNTISKSIRERNKKPDFKKKILDGLQKPETRKKLSEKARQETIERNRIPDATYPKAQRVLYESLLPFIPDLVWEYRVDVSKINDNYNRKYFRLDIAHCPTKVNIEVDGFWGHGGELDKERDKVLVSLGWHVIRIDNIEVITDLKTTLFKIVSTIYEKEKTNEDYL